MTACWTVALGRRYFCKFTLQLLYVSFKNPSIQWAVPRAGVDMGKTGKIVAPGESRNKTFQPTGAVRFEVEIRFPAAEFLTFLFNIIARMNVATSIVFLPYIQTTYVQPH
jgi:hypothetical protein